jgi:hypothetical protein
MSEASKDATTRKRRIYVRQAPAGTWIVHDEGESSGGLFRGRDAALRFAEEMFGLGAEILVQPSTALA